MREELDKPQFCWRFGNNDFWWKRQVQIFTLRDPGCGLGKAKWWEFAEQRVQGSKVQGNREHGSTKWHRNGWLGVKRWRPQESHSLWLSWQCLFPSCPFTIVVCPKLTENYGNSICCRYENRVKMHESYFLTNSRNLLLWPLESVRFCFSSGKAGLKADLLLLRNIFFFYYLFISVFKGNLSFLGLYLHFYVTF